MRADIEKRGDWSQWMAGFDGFYLTRGHHSNNASATLHDVYSDRIAWFVHCTKRGKNSNWQGTSSGAEGSSTWLLKIWIEYIVDVFTCMYINVCMLL